MLAGETRAVGYGPRSMLKPVELRLGSSGRRIHSGPHSRSDEKLLRSFLLPMRCLRSLRQQALLLLPRRRCPRRAFSTAPQAPPQPAWVRSLNSSIDSYPVETLSAYVACDIGAIGFWFSLVTAVGIEGSADLVVALGISRILRRVRLPVDLAVAAVLARVYPPLTQVNITRLFVQPAVESPPPGAAPATRAGFSSSLRGHAADGLRTVGRLVDRYGLALTVAQVWGGWWGWRGVSS